MKNKYISFFKKEIVFLLLLLIVVCISFGITYANFVFDSENKRAVEMFTGALTYNLKINGTYQNNITVPSGSSILNIEIEGMNEISSYYKLLTTSNATIYSIEGNTNGIIGPTDKVSIKLYIVNNKQEEVVVPFIVSMGYITNKLDDVIIKDNYHEINNIKSEITYDNKKWNVLRVNEDASIDLVSKETYNIKLSGYSSYNNLSDLLNSKCSTIGSKSLNAIDVGGINIITDTEYTTINRLIYYPSVLKNSEDFIVNNNSNETTYDYTNHLLVKNKMIVSDIANELFKKNKYLLNTNYYEVINNEVNYYVIEVDNGVVNLKKLYDSNNTNYEITSNVKCKLNIKNISF